MPIPTEMYRELHLLPSILSADFSRLGEQVSLVMDAGIKVIHVDVMDGHFVPNITVGPLVVEAMAPLVHGCGSRFSVHLMIERPEDYVEAFVRAGADAVSVHVEACSCLYHTLQTIKSLGAGAGVAINPGTDLVRLVDFLPLVDYVVVMTVNPGFGGQRLIGSVLEKITRLRQMLPAGAAIEVDGGINRENIRQVVELGGNWLVSGSAIFGSADPSGEARSLQDLMTGAAPVW